MHSAPLSGRVAANLPLGMALPPASESSMRRRISYPALAFVLTAVAACSDVSSPTAPASTAPSFAKGAAGGGGAGGVAVPVDLNGSWNGFITRTPNNCQFSCFSVVDPLTLIIAEDASGNVTGVAPYGRGQWAGTAKADGSFSGRTTEGFSVTAKANARVCGDGSVGTALTGSMQFNVLGGNSFSGAFSVDNCPSAPPVV